MPRDWKASWVWPENHRVVNAHVLFRRDCELPRAPRSVRLFIAAESFATVWVNGAQVLRTTSISYPGHHVYEEADVSRAWRTGKNAVSVLVRYIGIPGSASVPQDPGLLCEFVVRHAKGKATSFGSDAGWKALRLDAWLGQQPRSEWLNLDLVEIQDLRRLPKGWPTPKINEAFEAPRATRDPSARFPRVEARAFPKCGLKEAPAPTLVSAGVARDRSAGFAIPAIAVSHEEVEPAPLGIHGVRGFTVPSPGRGRASVVVADLGRYEAGWPELVVRGEAGAVLDLSCHEVLSNGRFDVRATKVYATDRFLLREGANRVCTEEWKAGRFLQLTFRNHRRPLRVEGLQWVSSRYPVRQRAFFSSSDETLERIFEISLNAARLCMQDNIMDCPWRERRQWLGDIQRIALINHYALDDRALVRGMLRQAARLQDGTGRIWVCLPILEEFPTQSMEWLRAILEYEEFTGDATLLDELFDHVEMLHRWFLRNRDPRGLFFVKDPPKMSWMDNPLNGLMRDHQYRTAFLAENLRYLQFLDDMARAFARTRRPAEAREARAERARLAARIPRAFRDRATGLFRDCADPSIPATFSEFGHALAAVCDLPGIPPAALWDAFEAKRRIVGGRFIPCSPFGKYATHEALGRLGRPEAIVRDVLEHWGPMVAEGSDTTWESFGGKESRCHGWAGIPVVSLLRHVLRMDPRKRGAVQVRGLAGVGRIACEIRRGASGA
jgi:hypothetical protein